MLLRLGTGHGRNCLTAISFIDDRVGSFSPYLSKSFNKRHSEDKGSLQGSFGNLHQNLVDLDILDARYLNRGHPGSLGAPSGDVERDLLP